MRAANGGVEPGKENEPKAPKLSRGGHEEATNKEIAFMALATMVGVFFAGGIMVRSRSSLSSFLLLNLFLNSKRNLY